LKKTLGSRGKKTSGRHRWTAAVISHKYKSQGGWSYHLCLGPKDGRKEERGGRQFSDMKRSTGMRGLTRQAPSQCPPAGEEHACITKNSYQSTAGGDAFKGLHNWTESLKKKKIVQEKISEKGMKVAQSTPILTLGRDEDLFLSTLEEQENR